MGSALSSLFLTSSFSCWKDLKKDLYMRKRGDGLKADKAVWNVCPGLHGFGTQFCN